MDEARKARAKKKELEARKARAKARVAQLRHLSLHQITPQQPTRNTSKKQRSKKQPARNTSKKEIEQAPTPPWKPKCYQQGDADCSHYSVRIAAEFVLKRDMTPDEEAKFDDWPCSRHGDLFDNTVLTFQALFGETMPVMFERFPPHGGRVRTRHNRKQKEAAWKAEMAAGSARNTLKKEIERQKEAAREPNEQIWVKMEQIEQCLKDGFILLLNIQNMKFTKDTIVEAAKGDGGEGHCICCIGGAKKTDKYLTLLDSNRYNNKCLKTVLKETLSENESILSKETDLDKRLDLMKTKMHVSEVYKVKAY